ncbi:hypothetical protein [Sphingomonas hankookensis]|uniref:hypothetical protein n=1 Tax=Sphingomonas hankookensis TaxID=563996 RepID=UPI003F7A422A
MKNIRCSVRPILYGMALAASGTVAVLPASAQTAFETIDRTAQADVSFSSGERGKPILAGSVVTVTGEKFRPNQKVTLLYGTNPLPGGELTADAEGKVSTRITLPANAAPGIHPIMVVAQAPYSASIAELKVSPTVPLAGQGNYTLTHGEVARGLYQSAYSTKNNTLFVASAVGRPPVGQSEILKLNADTLAVLARVTPAEAPMPERRGGRGLPRGNHPPRRRRTCSPFTGSAWTTPRVRCGSRIHARTRSRCTASRTCRSSSSSPPVP